MDILRQYCPRRAHRPLLRRPDRRVVRRALRRQGDPLHWRHRHHWRPHVLAAARAATEGSGLVPSCIGPSAWARDTVQHSFLMDWLAPDQRSRNMAAIRSHGNRSTENAIRFRMIRAGVCGFKLCASNLPGRPDFVFENARLVVFLDGCYWHGCPRCYRAPASNTGYWSQKFARNKARDRKVGRLLRAGGWRVVRFWEHEIEHNPARVVERIKKPAISQPSE